MLVVLGFLCASLIALLITPAYRKRIMRLTTRQLKESLPVSEDEIRAQNDRIRAEFAMRVHRLETQKNEAQLAARRRLIEINRRDAAVSALEAELERMKASLEENQNARRVLEQTVSDRLPKVEQRLEEARQLLFNRDREIATVRDEARKLKQAFDEATSINEQQAAQIERLNMSLATRAAKRSPDPREAGFEIELALRSELEAMRAKSRDQAALISRLQEQLGQGFKHEGVDHAGDGLDVAHSANGNGAEAADMGQLTSSLVSAQSALQNAIGIGAQNEATRRLQEEIRKLTATTQDQTGEILRLKAALATFEGADKSETHTIRDSKIALKARLNAVQAQTEQQSSVIAQLRAELAAAHERTAMQAHHFKTEMRRLGAGTLPAAGLSGRSLKTTQPASLAERLAKPDDTTEAQAAVSMDDAGSGETGHAGNDHRNDGDLADSPKGLPSRLERAVASTNGKSDGGDDKLARTDEMQETTGMRHGKRSGPGMIERLSRGRGKKTAKSDSPTEEASSSKAARDGEEARADVLVEPRLKNGDAAKPGPETEKPVRRRAENAKTKNGASTTGKSDTGRTQDNNSPAKNDKVDAGKVDAGNGRVKETVAVSASKRPKSRLMERIIGSSKGSS